MIIIITDNILLILVQFDCWQDKQKKSIFVWYKLFNKKNIVSFNE